MSDRSDDSGAGDRLKVFVSYSRADIAFADQLVLALEDKGFDPILDRHDIDAAEAWKDRLGALILSCDTVVFVLSEASAKSPICAWEVEQAAAHGKRMVPVVHGPIEGVTPPPHLTALNYIHFYFTPAIPGSGFYDGVQRLTHALHVDLSWLRQQTRLSERAAEWRAQAAGSRRPEDHLLRATTLAEAQEWLGRAPKDTNIPDVLRDYIAASEIAEVQRNADAAAQVAARESAVAEKEAAVAAREKADKLARRATWVGGGVATLLLMLGGWMTWTAVQATRAASENNAMLFANAAYERMSGERHAEALQLALAGDPTAQRSGLARFLGLQGYRPVSNALTAAYTQNRLVRIFEGHQGGVYSVAVSRDGSRVLTAGGDDAVRLWDAQTGQNIRTFEADVTRAALSPDGSRVLAGDRDGVALLWDAESGRLLRTLEGHRFGPVYAVAFSADGAYAVTGGLFEARVWNAETGRTISVCWGHRGSVVSVAFSPDGSRVLTGSDDSTARLWDTRTGRVIRIFEGHENGVSSVSFIGDGTRILTGSGDATARIWDAQTGQTIRTFESRGENVLSVAATADGKRLLTTSYEGATVLWDAETGRSITTFEGHQGWGQSVGVSSDGLLALTGAEDGVVRLWNIGAIGAVATFDHNSAGVAEAVFSRNGLRILTGAHDNSARLWDVQTGQLLRTLRGHRAVVYAVAFSPDGGRILTGSWDGNAKLWDTESGQEIRAFEGHDAGIGAVAFSPDGSTLLTGSSDGTARLWDAETGRTIRIFEGHDGGVFSVAFSRNGSRVLTGATDYTVRLWDIDTGETLQNFEGSRAAFSPDERTIFTSSEDGTGRLWNIETGQVIRVFEGHTESLTSVAFAPNGSHILTASFNDTRIWDVETARVVWMFQPSFGRGEYSSAFSPDGSQILTSSGDGVARIWNIDPIVFASPGEQVRLACDTLRSVGLTRFSDADRQRFPSLANQESPCPPARTRP